MSGHSQKPGKLIAIYGIAPVYLQRAVFVIVLSFLFFLGMMFAYYILQSALYFLLASGFLVMYLITMFSFVMQRKNIVKISENGVEYRKFYAAWNEIESVSPFGAKQQSGLEITAKSGKKALIPPTINGIDEIDNIIRSRIAKTAGIREE